MSSDEAGARTESRIESRRTGIGLVLWVLVLAGSTYYYATTSLDPSRFVPATRVLQGYRRIFAGLVSGYWYWIALVALVILMIAGQLGAGLGIPGLFRDPPPPRPGRDAEVKGEPGRRRQGGFGAAFWGSVGVSLLIAQVWTSIYFAERINHLSDYTGRGSGGVERGQPHLITDFAAHHELLVFLAKGCPPFLLMALLAVAVPAPAPGVRRDLASVAAALVRYLLGMVVAAVTVVVLALVGGWLHTHAIGAPGALPGWFDGVFTIGQFPAPYNIPKSTVMISFAFFFAVYVVEVFTLTVFFRTSLSPGLGICAVLSGVVMLFAVLGALAPPWRLPAFALALAILAWTNSGAYKYRFPGMDMYQRRRVSIEDYHPDATPSPPLLLKDDAVLEAWRSKAAREKPKLLLVAVTGGAYRASFWTAVVLDELCGHPSLPGFARGIRLLTGASGGMVGAAYYAALTSPEGPAPGGVVERLRLDSQLDSLTPVVRQLIRRDMPQTLRFWPQRVDRGVVLERQWSALDVSFAGLRDGERDGWRPSLIVSPMVVETGRRLLVSNLDLHNLAETTSEALTRVSKDGGAEPRPGGPPPRLYSRSAVQFFGLFPEAHPTFKVATAVRMNASFPYASPAVSLPTTPPRRVVDAGYYDNYGVDVACVWAYLNRDWVREHTSGLGLVQIRAYQSESVRQHLYVPGRDAPPAGLAAGLIGHLQTSLQWLTSPVEGALSARAWSMSFRNDELVSVLADTFNTADRPPRFFETFVFENPTDFGMNWFVSDDDIDSMRQSISDAPPRADGTAVERQSDAANLAQKRLLIDWWNG